LRAEKEKRKKSNKEAPKVAALVKSGQLGGQVERSQADP